MKDEMEELKNNINLVLDVLNQLEFYKIIPSEIIERSRNRIRINELKEKYKDHPSEQINEKIKSCLNKELDYHKTLESIMQNKCHG